MRLRNTFLGVMAFLSMANYGQDFYRNGKNLIETMEKSGNAFKKLEKEGKATSAQISNWWYSGVMRDKGFNDSLFPEKNVDLNAQENGKKIWTEKPEWTDGKVYDFNYGGRAVVYLYREITVSVAMKMPASFGSDDGIQAWLNGKQIISNNASRGASADQEVVTLDLKKGKNTLLLKIINGNGGFGFYCMLTDGMSIFKSRLLEMFPVDGGLILTNFSGEQFSNWIAGKNRDEIEKNVFEKLTNSLGNIAGNLSVDFSKAKSTTEKLRLIKIAAERSKSLEVTRQILPLFNPRALEESIKFLARKYRKKYLNGNSSDYLNKLKAFAAELPEVSKKINEKDVNLAVLEKAQKMIEFQRETQLANPLVNFDEILVVERITNGNADKFGFPFNWQGNTSMNKTGHENSIVKYNIKNPAKAKEVVLQGKDKKFVGDVDLHWDNNKFLYSSIDEKGRWQVFEKDLKGNNIRQVTDGSNSDIDSYDACYLPNGKIIYNSTTGYTGVPCVTGSDYVGNLHLLDNDGKTVRRLCFEQDNNWDPVVRSDGRIMYQRWEYTDSAHYFSRVLMTMNPDGTNQGSLYGSNSYWPNTLFYARQSPETPSRFFAIVSGHHGVKREGELVLFDTDLGTKSIEGAVQKIAYSGKEVVEEIKDEYANNKWPKFVHPFPLSDKYVIVAMRQRNDKDFGIYLVDTFDNMTLLAQVPNTSLFEPLPFKVQKRPPVVTDKVINPKAETGRLYIQDIYSGPGLEGVPRGTVKKLRIYQYEYSYRNTGGHYVIGMEGPWDVRRLLGTVDVNEDGSVMFNVPANRPLSIQPLDAEGKALQLFRSWLVVMPGETLACIGCHENKNMAPAGRENAASKNPPQEIKPWYGEVRGFSFNREVQPVLDQYCIGCHDGTNKSVPNFDRKQQEVRHSQGGKFPRSYWELMKYVRRNGPEGDYNLLTPLEFHADTSRLVQLLQKGHYNVKLSPEAWDRIITWIDLNVPAHGTWNEATHITKEAENRRKSLAEKYGNVYEDIEKIVPVTNTDVKYIPPAPLKEIPARFTGKVKGWPFEAKIGKEMVLDLGNNVKMNFRLIPAGKFIMGDEKGYLDEVPRTEQTIAKSFYMGTTEVTLEQFKQFKKEHKNRYYDMHYKDQVKPGYDMDTNLKFPAIRVSWEEANEFCKWLSKKTGKKVSLPTESQWEFAARAGAETQLSYGDRNTDFSKKANLADYSIKQLAVVGVNPQPIRNPSPEWDFELKDDRFNDGVLHLAPVGNYEPNAFGLYDMVGNVAEWTKDDYKPYPYNPTTTNGAKKSVRGGSWFDRPIRARSAYRLGFPQWQKVYNVGFRVVVE